MSHVYFGTKKWSLHILLYGKKTFMLHFCFVNITLCPLHMATSEFFLCLDYWAHSLQLTFCIHTEMTSTYQEWNIWGCSNPMFDSILLSLCSAIAKNNLNSSKPHLLAAHMARRVFTLQSSTNPCMANIWMPSSWFCILIINNTKDINFNFTKVSFLCVLLSFTFFNIWGSCQFWKRRRKKLY